MCVGRLTKESDSFRLHIFCEIEKLYCIVETLRQTKKVYVKIDWI